MEVIKEIIKIPNLEDYNEDELWILFEKDCISLGELCLILGRNTILLDKDRLNKIIKQGKIKVINNERKESVLQLKILLERLRPQASNSIYFELPFLFELFKYDIDITNNAAIKAEIIRLFNEKEIDILCEPTVQDGVPSITCGNTTPLSSSPQEVKDMIIDFPIDFFLYTSYRFYPKKY